MKYFLTVLWFYMAALSPALAQMMPPPPPSLTMTGEAKEQVAPDQAVITATLSSREQNLNVAKKNNDEQLERIVNIAKEYGIPKDKIVPSYLNISPEYTYNNGKQRQEMMGYIVSRSLRITMDKLDIHERVLAALVEAKIDQVGGVEFTLSNPEAISDRLRLKAMENAKTKAVALAQAAGVKLGRPLNISVSGGYTPPMYPMAMMGRAAMADGAAEKMSVAPSLPGTVEMRESVNVVFALE